MSEILNCVEQREEQTELEEAGGAEVRWALKWALSPLSTAYIIHRAAAKVSNPVPIVPERYPLVPETQPC